MKLKVMRLDNTNLVLILILVCVVFINGSAMWSDYKNTKKIKSDNPSGSSLVERYLILGDWPASKHLDFMQSDTRYSINSDSIPEQATPKVEYSQND